MTFFIHEYRPSYEIILPKNFEGEVTVFLSNEGRNDFIINKFGIGYINQKTYNNGFIPIIIKDDKNISKTIKDYSMGSSITSKIPNLKFNYMTFKVSQETEKRNVIEVENLIKLGALDTTRLPRNRSKE